MAGRAPVRRRRRGGPRLLRRPARPCRPPRCSAGGGGAGCPPARRWTGCSRPTAGTARSSPAPSRCTRCCSPAAAGGRARSTRPGSRCRCCATTPGLARLSAGADGVRPAPAAAVHEQAEGPAADGRAPRRRHGGDGLRRAADHRRLPADVGPDVVLGAMDMRGLPAPFFFLLERDDGQLTGTSSSASRARIRPLDLVADRADGVDALAGRVVELPSPGSACRGRSGRRRRSPW